jgi:hypothetical protein
MAQSTSAIVFVRLRVAHKAVPELTANRRADLRDFLGRGEPVEARHQRVLQGGRNRQRRQRTAQAVARRRILQQARLHHSLRQFFDEQRDAVRFADDFGEYLDWKCLARSDRTHQRRALLVRQPVQAVAGQLRRITP